MKVLFDTNVLYSATVYIGSECAKFFEAPFLERFELVISEGILDELKAILKRPKAQKVILKKGVQDRVEIFINTLKNCLQKDEENAIQYSVPNDSKDDHVFTAAINLNIHYLVTGDKHLLSLKKAEELDYLELKIMSPGEFLRMISN